MKTLIRKLVSINMIILLILLNAIPTYASTNSETNSNREIINTESNDNKEFHEKLDDITTFDKDDIEDLSEVADITTTDQNNGLVQYTIIEKEPSTIITYNDGSSESLKEAVALLVVNKENLAVTKSTNAIRKLSTSTDFSDYTTTKTGSNGDIKLKATMVYSEMDATGSNWSITCLKITQVKGCIVSFSERYKKNLVITGTQSGASYNSSATFKGLHKESVTKTVSSPSTGTTYSKSSGFSYYVDETSGAGTVTVSCDMSHDGSDYYTYEVSFTVGSYTIS